MHDSVSIVIVWIDFKGAADVGEPVCIPLSCKTVLLVIQAAT